MLFEPLENRGAAPRMEASELAIAPSHVKARKEPTTLWRPVRRKASERGTLDNRRTGQSPQSSDIFILNELSDHRRVPHAFSLAAASIRSRCAESTFSYFASVISSRNLQVTAITRSALSDIARIGPRLLLMENHHITLTHRAIAQPLDFEKTTRNTPLIAVSFGDVCPVNGDCRCWRCNSCTAMSSRIAIARQGRAVCSPHPGLPLRACVNPRGSRSVSEIAQRPAEAALSNQIFR